MNDSGLKQVKKKAREIFGDAGRINEWFESDNKDLSGRKPKDCELNEVLKLIIEIEYGK
jgi:hypothetical protein